MTITKNDPLLDAFLLNSIDSGVCAIDIEGMIIRASDSLRCLLGYHPAQPFVASFFDLIHSDDVFAVQQMKSLLNEETPDKRRWRIRMRCHDGAAIWVSVHFSGKKQFSGFTGLFVVQVAVEETPGTEHLATGLKPWQPKDAMATFAGGIAHGLNNVLSSILGNAEFALHHELEKGQPGIYSMQQIVKAADRATFLTKQILTLSRWKSQEPSLVNLSPIIKELFKFLKATIPADISVSLSLQTDVDLVLADPVKIHRLLWELCAHAVDGLVPEGGTLEISLAEAESKANPGRKASGNGRAGFVELNMVYSDRQESELLREPEGSDDIRAADDKAENRLASGLISVLVKDLKGDFKVGIDSAGRKYLTVLLPVYTQREEQAEIVEKPLPGGSANILFVDDDEQIVEYMERSLGMLGYSVTGKFSSIDALETFRRSPEKFDLLISDMNMEGLTGDELTQKILEIQPELPVIICTGFDEMLTRARSKEIGIDAVIMKPFMMDEIDLLIRQVLKKEL